MPAAKSQTEVAIAAPGVTIISKARSLPELSAYSIARGPSVRVSRCFEDELELAFSNTSGQKLQKADTQDKISRSPSFDLASSPFSNDAALGEAHDITGSSSAAYAQEAPARPASSLSNYTSRLDPKAVAAQQAEESSGRLRFSRSLLPQILVMPAPLADLAHSEQQYQKDEAIESHVDPRKERQNSAIEREPGKLYGKSLMDELNERKQRQKSKQRAFQGDNRRAMMDNAVMQNYRHHRTPSPLSGMADKYEKQAEIYGLWEPKGPDYDNKAWPPYNLNNTPQILTGMSPDSANIAAFSQKDQNTLGYFASRGNLQTVKSPLKTAFVQPQNIKTPLSTKELQEQYKVSKHILSLSFSPRASPDSDSDDNAPLGDRSSSLAKLTSANETSAVQPLPSLPSVFGKDLVMARELKKLEEILKLEEVERKIEAEHTRIREADRRIKESKKMEKANKKSRTKADPKQSSKEDTLEHFGKRHDDRNSSSENSDVGVDGNWLTYTPWISELTSAADEYAHAEQFNRSEKPVMHSAIQEEVLRSSMTHEQGPPPFPGAPAFPQVSRPRPARIAPSLDLDSLSTAKAENILQWKHENDSSTSWFGPSSDTSFASDMSGGDSDDMEKSAVRSQSRSGLVSFGDMQVNDDEVLQDHLQAERSALPELAPKLKPHSRTASLASALESFGIGGSDSESDDHSKEPIVKKGFTDMSDAKEEEIPLFDILERRNEGLLTSNPLEPPRLNLPSDIITDLTEDEKRENSEENVDTDNVPLALRNSDSNRVSTKGLDEESDYNDEDDIPLAVQHNENRPLGQSLPVLAFMPDQQILLQQQQNMLLMTQRQLQYQMHMQMQMQSAAFQQFGVPTILLVSMAC